MPQTNAILIHACLARRFPLSQVTYRVLDLGYCPFLTSPTYPPQRLMQSQTFALLPPSKLSLVNPSTDPLNSVPIIRHHRLIPRPLSPDWHAKSMPPPTIRSHILQSPYIIPQLSPQIVLNFHGSQLGRDV